MAEDGWTGRSPIAVAADSMGLAIAGQDAAVKSATGSNVRAVAKLAGHYQNDEQYQRNRARLKAAMTDGDGVAVIGDTDDIKTLNMSAADMQLLENRKFDREQIAAMWRVPPSKLQMLEHGVKANGQQQAVDYKSDGLSHWGGFAAAYLSEGLLTEAEKRAGLFLRFDYAALMEATTREAYEATVKAVGGPFKTPNEGRADHGLPPVTDGDALYPPANMTRDTKTETEGADE
jgi:HK97 family phage portal protein